MADCGCGGKTAAQRAQALQDRANSQQSQQQVKQAAASGQVGGVTIPTADYIAELRKLQGN